MKSIKKITAACIAALLAALAFAASAGAAEATETQNTAVVSVEAFSIGNGYVVEPTEIAFTEGETVAAVVDRLFKQKNISIEATGSVNENFYIKNVNFKNTNKIPDYIRNAVVAHDDETDEDILFDEYLDEGSPNSLGSNDYCYYLSGWMYTVNNPTAEALSLGMSQTKVNNGDVIRVQFSLDCGADIGTANLSGMPQWGYHSDFYPVADKTELTRAIAKAKVQELTPQYNAYKKMIAVAENLPASQKEVDEELNAYNALVESGAIRGDVDGNGRITVADAVLIQKSIANIICFDSMQASVADCDSNGRITVADAVTIQKNIANIITA